MYCYVNCACAIILSLNRMMEESRVVVSDDNLDYDSFDDQSYESDRPMERWAPLGAASDPKPTTPIPEQR